MDGAKDRGKNGGISEWFFLSQRSYSFASPGKRVDWIYTDLILHCKASGSQRFYDKIWRKELYVGGEFIITQNALPSKWEAIEGNRVGVVCRHYSESFMLFGEFKALGNGVVKSNRLVEGHVCPTIMVSLVDTATWPQREERVTDDDWWLVGTLSDREDNVP